MDYENHPWRLCQDHGIIYAQVYHNGRHRGLDRQGKLKPFGYCHWLVCPQSHTSDGAYKVFPPPGYYINRNVSYLDGLNEKELV